SLTNALRNACEKAIKAEPDITKYDIQMGDGDCGEAVQTVSESILRKLDKPEFPSAPLFKQLEMIGDSIEDMGGSLGAIISILVTAFSNSLRDIYTKSGNQGKSDFSLDLKAVGAAAAQALENLKDYTGAREGDRTVMDTLIPFISTLQSSANLEQAVKAAEDGSQKTAKMQPKFGRASYVGDKAESMDQLPPDPGAHAAAIFLRGLADGYGQ
ncbi:hypothetical protein LTS18_012889, partial [Coniosporium uncinatum]